MKQSIISVIVALVAFSCADKNNCIVNFELANCQDAKIVIQYSAPDDSVVVDTLVYTPDCKSQYRATVIEPSHATATIIREGVNDTHLPFIIEPAVITVKADMDNLVDDGPESGCSCLDLKIEGGRNNAFVSGIEALEDSLLAQPKYAGYAAAYDELKRMGHADMKRYVAKLSEIRTKFDDIQAQFADERMNILAAYVLSNTDCEESAYRYEIYNGRVSKSPEEFVSGFDAFPEKVKHSLIAKKTLKKVERMRAVLPGCVAPDFTLLTPDGTEFTLSSLRGKYCLVDFWGSWCHWCVVAISTLKSIYSKYSDNLEIVSIDCRDTKEKWLKAIEEHDMPWTQVKNEDADRVPENYGVQGYPTFVVIDPEGKIIRSFLGETEEFAPFFDTLFSK